MKLRPCVDCGGERAPRARKYCVPCAKARESARSRKRCRSGSRKESDKAYRARNKDSITRVKRRWEENNKERVRERQSRYRAKNRDKCIQATRAWCEKNPERVKLLSARSQQKRTARGASRDYRQRNPLVYAAMCLRQQYGLPSDYVFTKDVLDLKVDQLELTRELRGAKREARHGAYGAGNNGA